jgi:hypothetical protein
MESIWLLVVVFTAGYFIGKSYWRRHAEDSATKAARYHGELLRSQAIVKALLARIEALEARDSSQASSTAVNRVQSATRRQSLPPADDTTSLPKPRDGATAERLSSVQPTPEQGQILPQFQHATEAETTRASRRYFSPPVDKGKLGFLNERAAAKPDIEKQASQRRHADRKKARGEIAYLHFFLRRVYGFRVESDLKAFLGLLEEYAHAKGIKSATTRALAQRIYKDFDGTDESLASLSIWVRNLEAKSRRWQDANQMPSKRESAVSKAAVDRLNQRQQDLYGD